MIRKHGHSAARWVLATLLFLPGCQDGPDPTGPMGGSEPQASFGSSGRAQRPFARVSSEVLALPRTVYAAHDGSEARFVFGVEHRGVIPDVRGVLARMDFPPSAYSVRVVEPIHFMGHTLQSEHRPTRGGIQIHFSRFLCTLGFSAGGSNDALAVFERSFFTNSHCTDRQGTSTGTVYYQPTSSASPSPIGVEVDDPEYFMGGDCSRGKKCRYSDAARALYASGIESLGAIARTAGVNTGSVDVDGSFDITGQDAASTQFTGALHKVGRTTGWTMGGVPSVDGIDLTCVTVNVFGSNIQLLCQTLVTGDGAVIAGPGDSGSPVFRATGGSRAELVGILWGGSSSGDEFVFSPLKNIQDELGAFDATTDGTGVGGGDGDGGGPRCPPNSRSPDCAS